jgi:catechol 2,3-dioxygenase-like lactoylglutathione lyase family enzyme
MTAAAQPMFRRINHIGVIVETLSDSQHWLAEIFGLPLNRTADIPEGQIHGEFYRCGEVDIEIVHIGEPEERRRRLGGAKVRIEHIAVEVDDLEGTLGRLSALGVKTTTPKPRLTGTALSAWTTEETTGGVSYQLMQFGEAKPAR